MRFEISVEPDLRTAKPAAGRAMLLRKMMFLTVAPPAVARVMVPVEFPVVMLTDPSVGAWSVKVMAAPPAVRRKTMVQVSRHGAELYLLCQGGVHHSSFHFRIRPSSVTATQRSPLWFAAKIT